MQASEMASRSGETITLVSALNSGNDALIISLVSFLLSFSILSERLST
jgi:hypothetical protein